MTMSRLLCVCLGDFLVAGLDTAAANCGYDVIRFIVLSVGMKAINLAFHATSEL
jgi:hypothetical protein